MNEFFYGALFGVALVALAGGLWSVRTWYRHSRNKQQVTEMRREQDAPVERTALAIDENDPPRFLTFTPRNGYSRNCDCHDLPLVAGQVVLFWPREDGSATLFCEDGVRESVKE